VSIPEFSDEELEALIEDAVIDAYGDDEQFMGMMVMVQENLELPFTTRVLGVKVSVVDVEERGLNIVAICERGEHRQVLPLTDLPIPDPPPEGVEWIAAWRLYASRY